MMPWYLRILDIAFFVVQFIILVIAINVVSPEGIIAGVIGFCILYIMLLWLTMGICLSLLPARHQKYFMDRSPDNPEGTRDIFAFFADVYNSIRNKLK